MKYILKSIFRMKNIALIMIVQLGIALALVNVVTELKDYSQNKANKMKEYFNINSTHLISIRQKNYLENMDYNFEEYNVFDEVTLEIMKLKGKDGFVDIYCYGESYGAPKEFYDLVANNKERGVIHDFVIDKNFNNRYKIKLSEGRGFSDEDFSLDYKKDNIPVILGGGLKDKFKVGDKMNWEARTSMSDDSKIMVTFEVVGFYKENEMIWFNTFDTLAGSAIFANSSIIYPRVKGLQDISYGNVLGDGGIYFELTPEMDIKEAHSAILEAIKPIGDKYGYEFNVVKSTSLQKDLELLGLNLDRDSGITKILAVVFTIISVLGITSTMLGELKRRKKEFGVRLSQGATINKICIELLIEIFLICLISSLFSLALVWWMNSAVTLSSRIILINLMYITILTCVISIIPLIFMRKMDIIELVRGK